jgi:hypothetical protein
MTLKCKENENFFCKENENFFCKENENFFCKENENFFSEVTKKLILFFPQTYREKQEKTKGNPEPF